MEQVKTETKMTDSDITFALGQAANDAIHAKAKELGIPVRNYDAIQVYLSLLTCCFVEEDKDKVRECVPSPADFTAALGLILSGGQEALARHFLAIGQATAYLHNQGKGAIERLSAGPGDGARILDY
jgi:hypothetical protein